ncbi:OmpA family protein [Hyalangium rubrum]|uniref:OmpA family protein n=1 Tax=Hyalangium rubrum TaxID=3103134 RepID=A0ABU5GWI9_9BACT|nr:OmpA family protein [Hyalangium sp. s54d21]MDY7225555.1 OmpA family protein [Hyalangium sp. s54d21]
MSSRHLSRWLGGAFALLATTALAQDQRIPGFELEKLQLNPGARDSLVLSTGDLLEQGRYRLGVTAHWEHKPLALFEGDEEVQVVVKDRATLHLSGAYALLDWLELGAQVPVVLQWANDLSSIGLTKPSSAALGTPWIQGRAKLLSEEGGSALDLGVHLGVGLPLGSSEALTRDKNIVFMPRLGLGKRLSDSWRVGADVGALVRTETYALSPGVTDPKDELGTELNGGLNISSIGEGLREELVVRGTLPLASSPASMEVLLGLRYPVGPVELYALGGPGFGRTPGTPSFRVLAGVAFGSDAAKNLCVEGSSAPPEVCPELDADGDGVKNAADACPTQPGLAELKGCPDKDDDGDGLLNLADRCPSEAENVNNFQDDDGCPDDPDSDGDGISDSKDRCPREAEDKDGFEDADGCPDRDNDKDGVADQADACPNEVGPAENRGCPDKDRDSDTIVDRLDNCPDEAGTVKNNGCKEKQLAEITTGRIRIMDSVYFDTGKDIIQRRSHKLLDNVASILKSHPEIEKVRVEGHTDNKGNEAANLDLSQRRAEAVVKYLVSRGVARERLEPKGFGQTQPIADNVTERGRSKNRRVEFKIAGAPEDAQPVQGTPNPENIQK